MAKREKKYYGCLGIEKSHKVGCFGISDIDLELSWADGMIGVLAVFSNRKKAIQYAGGKDNIFTLGEKNETEKT